MSLPHKRNPSGDTTLSLPKKDPQTAQASSLLSSRRPSVADGGAISDVAPESSIPGNVTDRSLIPEELSGDVTKVAKEESNGDDGGKAGKTPGVSYGTFSFLKKEENEQVKLESENMATIQERRVKVAIRGNATGNDISDDKITLDTLLKLKLAWEEANTDGSAGLEMDEFVNAFGNALGPDMTREQLVRLFMKIDANSDGSIDWDEFTNYLLLENEGQSLMKDESSVDELVKSDTVDMNPPKVHHRDMMNRVVVVPGKDSRASDKLITVSRDGTLKIWNSRDMSFIRTVKVSSSWLNDCVHMGPLNRLAVSSMDRSISFYDMSTYELVTRVKDVENMPLCMTYWQVPDRRRLTDILAFGDDRGFLQMYVLNEGNLEGARNVKLNLHNDWITKVKYISPMSSIVTCSLDHTIKVVDVEKQKIRRSMDNHMKGVYSFDWCATYKFIASCGLERHIIIWNPYTCKTIQNLYGHNSSVQDVIVNEDANQLISLSYDKVIKVWDVRNHRCLQTLVDKEAYRPENRISAMTFDFANKRLITGTTKMQIWPMRRTIKQQLGVQSHDAPICATLYNRTFYQVVSADDNSKINVWNLETGEKVFNFENAHEAKITAMCFDHRGRRLFTGAHDGTIRVWNFNNGALLKELSGFGNHEVTELIYCYENPTSKFIVAVGWGRQVCVWADVAPPAIGGGLCPITRKMEGHRADILCVAAALPNILVSGSADGQIIVWNLDSGYFKHKMQIPELGTYNTERQSGVEAVLFFMKKNRTFMTASTAGYLQFWNPNNGQLLMEMHSGHRKGEAITRVHTDETNSFVFTAGTLGCVKVWDISNLHVRPDGSILDPDFMLPIFYWRASETPVLALDYIEEKRMVMTATGDMRITLWTIEGSQVGVFGQKRIWDLDDIATHIRTEPEPGVLEDVDQYTSEAREVEEEEEPEYQREYNNLVLKLNGIQLDRGDQKMKNILKGLPFRVANEMKTYSIPENVDATKKWKQDKDVRKKKMLKLAGKVL